MCWRIEIIPKAMALILIMVRSCSSKPQLSDPEGWDLWPDSGKSKLPWSSEGELSFSPPLLSSDLSALCEDLGSSLSNCDPEVPWSSWGSSSCSPCPSSYRLPEVLEIWSCSTSTPTRLRCSCEIFIFCFSLEEENAKMINKLKDWGFSYL